MRFKISGEGERDPVSHVGLFANGRSGLNSESIMHKTCRALLSDATGPISEGTFSSAREGFRKE